MTFWDGVMIASCFWLFVCLFCMIRGFMYVWTDLDTPRFNWSDGYDDGWEAGWHEGVNIGLDHGYDAGFQAGQAFDPEEVNCE